MKKEFILTFLLFLSFLFFVYFLFPRYGQFKELKVELGKKELLLEQKRVYFSNLEKNLKLAKNYQEALIKIESALPSEISVADLLSFFQKKSSENGLILENFTQAEPSLKEKGGGEKKRGSSQIKETYFTLKLRGYWLGFENFLKNLENSSRIFETEKISLKEKKGGLLDIVIIVKVYSY